jgi:hypothetical protein
VLKWHGSAAGHAFLAATGQSGILANKVYLLSGNVRPPALSRVGGVGVLSIELVRCICDCGLVGLVAGPDRSLSVVLCRALQQGGLSA